MSGLGLNGALSMGAQALSNAQVALEVAGNNIANAGTTGYSRERANLTSNLSLSLSYGQEGTGATIASIQSMRDKLLDASVVRNSSSDGYYTTLANDMVVTQDALGENLTTSSTDGTATTTGIQSALNSFYDAWQTLSTDPTNDAYRQAVLTAGNDLTNDFQSVNKQLLQQQSDIATDATSVTTDIKTYSDTIASLNKQIASTEASTGNTANELRDQRQAALESLGQLVNITTTEQSNGMVNVSLADNSSIALVNGVNSSGSGSGSTQTYVLTSSYNTSNTASLSVTANTVPAGTAVDLTGTITSGQLGADLNMANTVIGSEHKNGDTGLLGQLDDVALSLVNDTNTQHEAGYSLATPTVNGTDFFVPTTGSTPTTGAGNIALAITDPKEIASSGVSNSTLDGSNATALANLRSDPSVLAAYQSTVTNLGLQVQQASQQQTSQALISKAISTQRDSVSGVSLDEELTNMQTYQRSYEASAKFITTIDQMLTTIINMVT